MNREKSLDDHDPTTKESYDRRLSSPSLAGREEVEHKSSPSQQPGRDCESSWYVTTRISQNRCQRGCILFHWNLKRELQSLALIQREIWLARSGNAPRRSNKICPERNRNASRNRPGNKLPSSTSLLLAGVERGVSDTALTRQYEIGRGASHVNFPPLHRRRGFDAV